MFLVGTSTETKIIFNNISLSGFLVTLSLGVSLSMSVHSILKQNTKMDSRIHQKLLSVFCQSLTNQVNQSYITYGVMVTLILKSLSFSLCAFTVAAMKQVYSRSFLHSGQTNHTVPM